MPSSRLAVTCALAAAFLPIPVALAVALLQPPAPHSTSLSDLPQVVPEPPPAEVVRKELAALTVEAPHPLEGYSRDKFEHWAAENRWPKIQEAVLRRDAKAVSPDTRARTASQHWHSPYDDRILTTASEVHVDHVVPLANAWRSGADKWSPARRHKFANDLSTTQLLAVSTHANWSKGNKSPDQWVPPNAAYHCVYSRAWTHVKFTYGLSVTEKEKAALNSMLDTCP
ncbi:HNH endonuclease [Streptomyces phyllanthi]|uniref:HNH endonuclease n=2 Tax=Streptomyces phyllanthi TaxID=1803180 RepID=A0A5N8VW16_9ACTN|nr:HNH endonuclease [Streptomyces phyllanthi]